MTYIIDIDAVAALVIGRACASAALIEFIRCDFVDSSFDFLAPDVVAISIASAT